MEPPPAAAAAAGAGACGSSPWLDECPARAGGSAWAELDGPGGLDVLVLTFAGLSLLWVVLFYALVWTEHWWAANVPPSSKAHENDRYWAARNLIGILHACLVSALTVPAVAVLAGDPDWIRYASSQNLGTCRAGADLAGALPPVSHAACVAVAFAGLAFTSFTAVDVVISSAHGLATPDFIIHHLAFVGAGLIIRGHCMLPYNSAILLAMEVSTPFLNYMLFYRHRGDAYNASVSIAGVVFVVFFVVFRLALNSYGAGLMLLRGRAIMPARVPAWQARFLLGAVALGSAVQFFWLPSIAKNFVEGLVGLVQGRDDKEGGSGASSWSTTCSAAGSDHSSGASAISSEEHEPSGARGAG